MFVRSQVSGLYSRQPPVSQTLHVLSTGVEITLCRGEQRTKLSPSPVGVQEFSFGFYVIIAAVRSPCTATHQSTSLVIISVFE